MIGLIDSGDSNITVTLNQASLPLSVSFHVMELADGALSELLPLRHEVDWGDKLGIFRDVVSGIHQMHSKRIVHRDLKASNVLLFDTSTRRPAAKVSDLGRSRDLAQPPRFDVDSYAAGRGDRSHAPPEHLWQLGSADHTALRKADVDLLGSVLYEFATGQGITAVTLPDWSSHLRAVGTMSPQEREASFRAAGRHMAEMHEIALGCWRMRHRPRYGTSSWTWCARCATPYLLAANAGSAQSATPRLGGSSGRSGEWTSSPRT